MALTVATNTGALMAQAAASSVNKEMEISMERLSTGKRINSASDDAAGVAIASRLTSEIRGTNQAIRNAMDGQALIDTAEGAHQEVENILQRMRELAVQAANDTNSSADRTSLQLEMTALNSEIDRIAQSTTWAGQKLLNGDHTGDSAAPTSAGDASFTFNVGSRTGSSDTITSTISSISAANLGLSTSVATMAADSTQTFGGNTTTSVDGNWAVDKTDGSVNSTTGAVTDAKLTFADGTNAVTNGDSIVITINGETFTLTADDTYNLGGAEGKADMFVEQFNASSSFPTLTASTTSTAGEVLLTQAAPTLSSTSAAQSAITAIDGAIVTLNAQRASLGAISNRLDSTVSNLTNISSNLQAGRGRIEDADFAAETTSLAKSQILQQASTAMLAQANASKQNVLSLLQG
jgi:flagellin